MAKEDSPSEQRFEPPESVLGAWREPLVVEGQVGRSVWLVRQGATGFILKKRASTLSPEAEGAMLRLLKERGIPVAPPVPASGGHQAFSHQTGQWSLYPRLPGRSATILSLALSEAHALGSALALLHQALVDVPEGSQLGSLVLKTDLRGCPAGLIHRDFHASNIFFEAGSVSGIVDFDLACNGPRIFDVAYLAVSLLADSWHSSTAQERFVVILREIVRGYESQSRLTAEEAHSIPSLMEEIEDMFVTLGRELGNESMELGAAGVKACLQARREEITAALGTKS